MKKTTRNLLLFLGFAVASIGSAYSQDPTNPQTLDIPIESDEVTEPKNTFVDYHSYILSADDFRFGKEIKKAKNDSAFLEYASTDHNIRISKYDYLRLLRRSVNQSESKNEFIDRMAAEFADTESQFTQTLDLESIYDSTRARTFYGYFDGLPRIHY